MSHAYNCVVHIHYILIVIEWLPLGYTSKTTILVRYLNKVSYDIMNVSKKLYNGYFIFF